MSVNACCDTQQNTVISNDNSILGCVKVTLSMCTPILYMGSEGTVPFITTPAFHEGGNLDLRNKSPFFLMARQPLGGLGRLIFRGFTITHFLDTPQSVGLLWTRDQPVAETST
jgi:hypothetical protein